MTALTLTLYNAQQGHAQLTAAWMFAKPLLHAGHKLTLTCAPHEEDKTEAQRKFYHACVLAEIAQQAVCNGKKYALPVWKEHFRRKYLGIDGNKRVTVTDPTTGKKSRRQVRISTEDLKVKGYSTLIDKVTAYAATELGVRFSATLQTWADIDPDTGEVRE